MFYEPIELYLFYSDTFRSLESLDDNIQAIIIDLEYKDKVERQVNLDTQINKHTLDDLRFLKQNFEHKIITRINGGRNIDLSEISKVIDAGADELLLPMIQNTHEVEKVLSAINGQCDLGVMIETIWSAENAKLLDNYPITSAYFGLNDFAIERKTSNIFLPLVDGTLDKVRASFSKPLSFGGLTHPNLGHPIPCYLLLCEMARLNCKFGFLRRSFYRDLSNYSIDVVCSEIQTKWNEYSHYPNDEYEPYRNILKKHILELENRVHLDD